MIVVVHGVAGSGKTTVGRLLADELGWEFFDADDFHSATNKELMQRGVALTDDDRLPWLRALQSAISRQHARGNAVFAISALRKEHRSILRDDAGDVHFVLLEIDPGTAHERLGRRQGHFFAPSLLESQFATLERSGDSLVVDATKPPNEVVSAIIEGLGLHTTR